MPLGVSQKTLDYVRCAVSRVPFQSTGGLDRNTDGRRRGVDCDIRTTVHPEPSSDITRVVLFILVIGALLLGSLWTLLPFLSGMVWATTIAVATWPLLLRLERATGRRTL